jgi:hypothetical protein
MIAENTSLDKLGLNYLTRLAQIYLLSEKLNKYIYDEKEYLERNIKRLNSKSIISNYSFQSVIRKYNKMTPSLLIEIKKNKPEEYQKIYKHVSLLYMKSRDEELLSLTEETFPSITWSSLFISTISYFEHCLIDTSEHLSKVTNIKLKLIDMSGGGVYEKFKNYCSKVVGLKYNFASKQWDNIINHYNVRNIVVHNNGYLDNSKKQKIENFIKKGKTSLLLKDSTIIIDKKYLDEVIFDIQDWIENFFKKS